MRYFVIGTLSAGLVSACGVGGLADTSEDAVADHARIAGTVMSRTQGPLPARAAALQTTGQTGDTTIEALAANGSTWGGTVTLRIVVSNRSGGAFGSEDRASGCFAYRFAYPRTQDIGQPHEVSCGSRPAIELTRPPLPRGITTSTRRRVIRAIGGLPAARRASAPAVRGVLVDALSADYTVAVGQDGAGVGGFVRYGDECLIVDTSSARTSVTRPLGKDSCFG